MPHDLMHARMLQARAEHDAQQRQEHLDRLSAAPKPGPDSIVSIAEAELLVQAHHYDEGEQIGLKLIGGLNDAHQVLRYSGGYVVADAHHDRVLKPLNRGVSVGTLTGWSVQAGRLVQRDEVA